jgi:hypothetical protein
MDIRVPKIRINSDVQLFAYAEARENSSQQFIAADLSGDFTQGLLSKPQLLRHEFTRLEFIQLPVTLIEVATRFFEGRQMPPSG